MHVPSKVIDLQIRGRAAASYGYNGPVQLIWRRTGRGAGLSWVVGGIIWMVGVFQAAGQSLTLTERLIDRLNCRTNQGAVVCGVMPTGRIAVAATVPLGGIDARGFDRSTPVVISVGDFEYAGVLGDDPKYVPGRNRATLLRTQVDPLTGKTREATRLSFSWNRHVMRLRLTANVERGSFIHAETITTAGHVTADQIALILFGNVMRIIEVVMSGRAEINVVSRSDGDFPLRRIQLVGKLTAGGALP